MRAVTDDPYFQMYYIPRYFYRRLFVQRAPKYQWQRRAVAVDHAWCCAPREKKGRREKRWKKSRRWRKRRWTRETREEESREREKRATAITGDENEREEREREKKMIVASTQRA